MDPLFLILLLFLAITSPTSSSTSDALSEGSSLSVEQPEDVLISPAGVFTAGFHQVGNNSYCFAIWFNEPSSSSSPVSYQNRTIVWMANRDQPVNGRHPLLSKQHRTEFNAGRLTKFNELINILSVAEKHDNILVKNYNSRPVGTKSVREANYNAPKRGRKERYPTNKGHVYPNRGHEGRMGPYNRPNKEGNRNFRAGTRGGNSTRGREEYNNTMGRNTVGRGGRIIRRGSSSNNPPREYPQRAPQIKKVNHNDVCHRCGSIEHWFKQCQASTQLAACYKEYREMREQEAHLAEEEDGEDVILTIKDFKAENEEHEDAADFD